MKNSILFLSVLFTSISFAQELATNKNGKIFNPESGDWGLSIEATPFINFAADLVHIGAGKTEDAPTFNGLNDQAPTWAISGKYFIANDRAIRASLRLNAKRDRQTSEIIYDPNATATNWPNNQSTDFTKDVFKTNDWAIALGGGYEWRKGTRRLQGYYGAECIIALSIEVTDIVMHMTSSLLILIPQRLIIFETTLPTLDKLQTYQENTFLVRLRSRME